MAISRGLIGVSVAILVTGLLGAGVVLRVQGSGDSNSAADTTASAERPAVSASSAFSTDIAIPVEAATVVRDTLVVSVNAAAQTAAVKESRLLAQVEGRVTRVRVRENDFVQGESVLLELDPTEYELAVERETAALARAEAQFRELILFDDEIDDPEVRAERKRVARAKSGLGEAEIALKEARLKLTRTKVRAPYSGRVATLKIVEGQTVRTGDELLTVVDLDPIKVEVQVLEGEIGFLNAGRKASVSFSAFPDEIFRGNIETINPVVDRETRTARVTVQVPNPEGRILPGMYARVSLEAKRFPDRILVPRSAIIERDRRTLVFVFAGEGRDGLAKWRYVTTGLSNDSLIEIVENPDTKMVEPGEVVLTDGHYSLIHDAHVRLVGNVKAAGGRPQ
ncbi:MAG: efflux RND transporter periplasmic adaptor subunit [Gemmatimonadales bacterium]